MYEHVYNFTFLKLHNDVKIIGPLIKSKHKLLAYRNVVPDPMFMPKCDSRSNLDIQ